MFDGLLAREYNNIILDLLFTLNEWMSLVKLRLQTDSTISFLRQSTAVLGQTIRRFVTSVCEDFDTGDLPQEESARGRLKAAMTEKAKSKAALQTKSAAPKPAGTNTQKKDKNTTAEPKKKRREFNLKTYKLHALGDYVETIIRFGTTDSYSTQLVSMFSTGIVSLLN